MHVYALLTQQLRMHRRGLAAWCAIWSLLILLFASVFNSISKDAAENSKIFDQLPKGIFSALNIDPSAYFTGIESFLSGQFLFLYLIAGSILALSLGIGSIGKKIENGTIASLLTKPISRPATYMTQFAVNALVLSSAGFLVGSFAWAAFNLLLDQSSISGAYFFSLFFGSSLLFIVFTALGQLLGLVLEGSRALPIGAGLVVASWFISSLGQLAHLPIWLQDLSLFHYLDITMLRDQFSLNIGRAICLTIFLSIFVFAGSYLFRQKDIYI